MRLMIKQIRLISVLLIGLGIALSASAAWGDERDHDQAKRLKEAGKILPLEHIVQKAKAKYPGRLIELELEREHGRYIYEVELVDRGGVVWELKYDAQTGEFLKRERED